MPSTDPVLVLASRSRDGALHRSAAELLTAARRIGVPVVVLTGSVDDRTRARLARYGAHRVLAAIDRGDQCTVIDAIAGAVRQLRPVAVLLPGDAAHSEVAGRLAVRLEAGIVTQVVAIGRGPDGISVMQESPNGRAVVESTVAREPCVLTIRPGAIPAEPDDEAVAPPVQELRVECAPAAPAPRLVRRTRAHPLDRKLLVDADVVVAGGRGVGSAEGFALLAEVAKALGGCLGATHTAGELGWAPAHARISLPGAQIRPGLYLAGGVSGSLRHRAAIRGARTVVAIDRDPRAPILREADLAVVGDLHEVLPALLAELRRRGRTGTTTTEPSEPPAEA
jgi:electron transfer flavoprotein alpha subunit